MSLTPQLEQLLARLPLEDQLNFTALDAALLHLRYTGPIVVHYLNGRKRQVDLGPPVRLTIVEGLDKGRPPTAG